MEQSLVIALLTKADITGFIAHIPDANGMPLCGATVKRENWEIQSFPAATLPPICRNCRDVAGINVGPSHKYARRPRGTRFKR